MGWHRTDQVLVNRLMDDPLMEGLKIELLPVDLFINGHVWAPWTVDNERLKLRLTNYFYIAHASWTQGHLAKIPKLIMAGEWYYPRCSFYDPAFLPGGGEDELRYKLDYGKRDELTL